MEFKQYRRTQIAEMRSVTDEEATTKIFHNRVSVSDVDLAAGSPKKGDMVARNPKNHDDQWLVAEQYFKDNFEPMEKTPEPQKLQSNIGAVSTSGGYNYGNGRCDKCGKPFVYVGDIPYGGFIEGLEPYCTCNLKKQTAGMYGWICPKCGAGLSPFTTICPCNMPRWEVTC